jgi:aminopeptidase N
LFAAARGYHVREYSLAITPDFTGHRISGSVRITFESTVLRLASIDLDANEIVIRKVSQDGRSLDFQHKSGIVAVPLTPPMKEREVRSIVLDYDGKPSHGIRFYSEYVYTFFDTSHWMPCNEDPGDRAKVSMDVIVPKRMKVVANGEPVEQHEQGANIVSRWVQNNPIPAFVIGFTAGIFAETNESAGGVTLRNLSAAHSDDQMQAALGVTKDMMEFFAKRAGAAYPGTVYTQVFEPGNIEQEAAGFTELPDSYADTLLADSKDVWLQAHEMAHQWWGISLTCADWSHFWLNEGIASFLADAFIEKQFGQDAYQKEIDRAHVRYADLRKHGKDRQLVHPGWRKPEPGYRELPYVKGAWVLYQLRELIGDKAFWDGLKAYTSQHMFASVTTADFEKAMEKASERDLAKFFAEKVYH